LPMIVIRPLWASLYVTGLARIDRQPQIAL
jgi:hypothetical protein